jgi:hypothetical protein
MDEAIRSGRYASRAEILRNNGISTGYIGEFKQRIAENPRAGMTSVMLSKFARALDVSEKELARGAAEEEAPLVDIYPERAWAVDAARSLKLPEAAIRAVMTEDPGRDPGRMYWFRRIESEAERAAPPADSGSFKL